jgi:hypothetical protein
VAAAAGFLLIAWGQYTVSQDDAPFHWPYTQSFQRWLEQDVFNAPNALAFALPLFLIGGAAVAAAAPAALATPIDRATGRRNLSRRRAMILAATLLPPLLVWAYINLRLLDGQYRPFYRWWFAVAVGCVFLTLLQIDRSAGRVCWPRVTRTHLLEALLVLALAGTFIGINARDLDSWRYSAIGDEGGFWYFAQLVLHGDHLNWFSQAGPDGYHPVLGSVWQATVMRIFGSGLFGWKMASALAIVFTFPMFYWLLRETLGVRVAAFGTLFLAASHYLFSYAHTGYDNVFPLFPTTAALAFFAAGLRRTSYALLFVAGCFAGFGWYTFYSSRSAIIMLAAAVLLAGRRGLRPEIIAVIGAGFVMSVTPIFATDKSEVIHQMFAQSRSQYDQTFLERIAENSPRTFLAFSFNPESHHYVAGALMDSVSFTLAVAGLFVALRRFRHFGYRIVVMWLLVAAAVTGIFSAYAFVSISRLSYLMPPMAALAAVGVDRLIAAAGFPVRRSSVERTLGVATFVALAPLLFVINGRHFFEYSARHSATPPETVVVREFTAPACQDQPLRDIAYAAPDNLLLYGIWGFFSLKDDLPLHLDSRDVSRVYNSYPATGGVGCTALINFNDAEVAAVRTRLEEGSSRDRAEFRWARDLSQQQKVAFVPAPDAPRGLDTAELARTWRTDLSQGSGLDGIVQGQEKDAIASIDAPTFTDINAAQLGDSEPVVVLQDAAGPRVYPIRALIWRGVVNDTLGGEPIAVTYDPIGATVRVLKRNVGGQVLSFGTSGLLRGGNALLYDRQTESWWQQMTGAAVAGTMTRTTLPAIPATVTSWGAFRARFPRGDVLALDDPEQYVRNPYLGYDVPAGKALFTRAPVDGRLPAMRRVAVIDLGGIPVAIAYPPATAHQDRVVTVTVDGTPLVLFFDWRIGSGLDVRLVRASRPVGAFAAYDAQVDGKARSFYPAGDQDGINVDQETGTSWDFYGRAVAGPGKGAQLTPVTTVQGFWFAVAAAYPGISIIEP